MGRAAEDRASRRQSAAASKAAMTKLRRPLAATGKGRSEAAAAAEEADRTTIDRRDVDQDNSSRNILQQQERQLSGYTERRPHY